MPTANPNAFRGSNVTDIPPDGTDLFDNNPTPSLGKESVQLGAIVTGVEAGQQEDWLASAVPLEGTPIYGADCAAGVRKFVTVGYKDIPFAVGFILQLLATGSAGVYNFVTTRVPTVTPSSTGGPQSELPPRMLASVGGAFSAAMVCCMIAMLAMRIFPRGFIWGANLVVIALNVLTAAVIFGTASEGARGAATAWLIFAGIHALWLFFARRRIPFAGVLLQHSISTVTRHYGTILVSFASLPVLGGYVYAWSYMSAPTLNALQEYSQSCTFQNGAEVCTDSYNQQPGGHPDPSGAAVLALVFLLMFYWTTQVITNVVHVTASGTVATWYFAGSANMPRNPTVASLKRAMTTSFGSICFGSLLVALLRLTHRLLRAQRNSRSFLALVALCCVGILERLLQYFNVYAFTHIAIYGTSYIEAAKATWQMTKSCGWAALFNDNLVEPVLMITSLVGSAAIGAAFGFGQSSWGIGLLCFVVAFMVHLVMLRVVYSGVVTVFVCVAENPDIVEFANPQLSRDLEVAAEELLQPTC